MDNSMAEPSEHVDVEHAKIGEKPAIQPVVTEGTEDQVTVDDVDPAPVVVEPTEEVITATSATGAENVPNVETVVDEAPSSPRIRANPSSEPVAPEA
jgi:hypothetical protein